MDTQRYRLRMAGLAAEQEPSFVARDYGCIDQQRQILLDLHGSPVTGDEAHPQAHWQYLPARRSNYEPLPEDYDGCDIREKELSE